MHWFILALFFHVLRCALRHHRAMRDHKSIHNQAYRRVMGW